MLPLQDGKQGSGKFAPGKVALSLQRHGVAVLQSEHWLNECWPLQGFFARGSVTPGAVHADATDR
jgi:hypothetical protein